MALIGVPNAVYNYPTADDPDPRWRDRCQTLSWYNERDTADTVDTYANEPAHTTGNTWRVTDTGYSITDSATSGSITWSVPDQIFIWDGSYWKWERDGRATKRPFPRTAQLIVVSYTDLWIIDAKDGAPWMRFANKTNTSMFWVPVGTGQIAPSVHALNGNVFYAARFDSNTIAGGVGVINFTTDIGRYYGEYYTRATYLSTISERNALASWDYLTTSSIKIVEGTPNDVHAAWVDGHLAVAVGTDGGVSVLKHVGEPTESVVDITQTTSAAARVQKVWLTATGSLYWLNDQATTGVDYPNIFVLRSIPVADLNCGTYYSNGSGVVDYEYYTTHAAPHICPTGALDGGLDLVLGGKSVLDSKSNSFVFSRELGISIVDELRGDETNGAVRYLTNTYCSELLVGDIRGNYAVPGDLADAATVDDVSAADSDLTAVAPTGTIQADPSSSFGSGHVFNGTDEYLVQKDYESVTGATFLTSNEIVSAAISFGPYKIAGGDAQYMWVATRDSDSAVMWGYLGAESLLSPGHANYCLSYTDKARTTLGANGTTWGSGTASTLVIRKTTFQITGGLITIGMWIKTSTTTDKRLVSRRDTTTVLDAYHSQSGTKLVFRIMLNGFLRLAESTIAINDGSWHHVVFSYDSVAIYIYIDGQLNASETFAGMSMNDTYLPLLIGALTTAGDQSWDGSIASPFITAEALSADVIRHMYEVGRRSLEANTNTPAVSTGLNTTAQLSAGKYSQLYGTSSQVKALDVDEDRNLLYAGTEDGLSIIDLDSMALTGYRHS